MAYLHYSLLLVVVVLATISPGCIMALKFTLPDWINEFKFLKGEKEVLEIPGNTIEFVSPVLQDLRKVSEPEYQKCFGGAALGMWTLQPSQSQVVTLKQGLHFFIAHPRSNCQRGAKMAVKVYGMMQQAPPPPPGR